MRPVGDRRQQPAEHVLGDVIAVRVPEHQDAAGVADDRVEVGGGDVLFARVEVRQPRGGTSAGDARPRLGPPARSTGTG